MGKKFFFLAIWGCLIRLCSGLRRDKLGLNWVCFGFELALIGFEIGLIGFELALFFWPSNGIKSL
ncbi:MAG: hypothetical protein H8D56_25140 [Planctomycetes bacterium]|nr:hypothetical protein [Planctomycetota bacterium]MBL7145132.1 hypothetical protein [Phycisphaerae bacterium]